MVLLQTSQCRGASIETRSAASGWGDSYRKVASSLLRLRQFPAHPGEQLGAYRSSPRLRCRSRSVEGLRRRGGR